MIDMLKRHAIQVVRQAGRTLDEIAERVEVGNRSVQRVIGEPQSRSTTPSRRGRCGRLAA